ncbi:MAG: DUF5985 family protein [Bdellovibrionales bacterium]
MLPVYISGAVTMGCWIVALFFYQFWSESKDRLFAIFAWAFVIMGLERVALLILVENERHAAFYLPRLLAFLLIICAIVDKNRAKQ